MENLSRKKIIENDIRDLLERVRKERITLKQGANGNELEIETDDTKNYSNYRKLVNSLTKLLDMYNSYNIYDKNRNKDFYIFLDKYLESEINHIHLSMKNALENEYDDQYRCLADVYTILIKLEDRIKIICRPEYNNSNDKSSQIQQKLNKIDVKNTKEIRINSDVVKDIEQCSNISIPVRGKRATVNGLIVEYAGVPIVLDESAKDGFEVVLKEKNDIFNNKNLKTFIEDKTFRENVILKIINDLHLDEEEAIVKYELDNFANKVSKRKNDDMVNEISEFIKTLNFFDVEKYNNKNFDSDKVGVIRKYAEEYYSVSLSSLRKDCIMIVQLINF